MKKRHRNRLMAGSLSLILLLGACSSKEATTTEEAEKETPVQVEKIDKGTLTLESEIIAKIVSDSSVDVMPKVMGELVKINVKKGDRVNKGDVLAVIDNSDQQLAVKMEETSARSTKSQYDQAVVSKQQAETAVKNAQIGVRQAELNVQKAKDGQETGIGNSDFGLNQAEINLQDAQINYDRMKDLYDVGAVSKQQLEQAETALDQAKIALGQAELQSNNASNETDIELAEQSLEQAKVGLLNAQQQLELAKIGIKQAQTGIDSNNLRIQQAKAQLSDFNIVATIAGEVTDVPYTVGDVVGTSAPFTTIVDLNQINVEAQISADQLSHFKNGQKIEVEVPSLNQTFEAQVTYISNVASETGFYTIEASILNHGGKIKPGMIARVMNKTNIGEESLLVPTNAIVEKGSESYIFTIEDGVAVQTPVAVIQAQSEVTSIEAEGLTENATIVTRGQNTLADGNKVRIIEGDQK